MRPRPVIVLPLAAVTAVTAFGGYAVAGLGDRKPQTDQAVASLTGERRVFVRQEVCQGRDGEYRKAVEVFGGVSQSDDPRLSGALTVRIKSFINRSPDQQEGTARGRIVIRDPASGRKKVEAHFDAVSDDGATFEGLLVGRVRAADGDDKAPGGRQRIVANFFGRFDAMDNEKDFAVTLGQEPPTDSARNSAVVQSGSCQDADRERGAGSRDDD